LAAITAAVVGVILNLAAWFGLHTLFRQVTPVRAFGVGLELPVLSSLDLASLALTVAAALAVFRFKVGVIPVLLACTAGGMLYYVVTGVTPGGL